MTFTSPPSRSSRGVLAGKRVLVIGVGGLGSAALLALADSGAHFVLCDDDQVELHNLHRQTLFDESAVGADKLDSTVRALTRRGVAPSNLELVRSRFLPENARELARSADLVLEGADNFATKFLAADACWLERRPIVHAAAVRFEGTVWCVTAAGRPCYRCLFEDIPGGAQQGCSDAGVLGPVVALCGALQAERALELLSGEDPGYGELVSFDGRRNRLRGVRIAPRADCPLCGEAPRITDIVESRYTAAVCAA